MPYPPKKHVVVPGVIALVLFLTANPVPAKEFHGIKTYYIRLDHYFTAHKSAKARVTMVPAENDFRAEIFSLVLVEGMIKADHQSSEKAIAAMARKEAFARILEAHGLKSVQTQDLDTTISYEGVIESPANISIATFDPARGGYPYSAAVKFSPLAFPDQWDALKTQYQIKQIVNDFFLLFK